MCGHVLFDDLADFADGVTVGVEQIAFLEAVDSGLYFFFVLGVVEGDFFGSGEVPPISHGVCLAEGRWRLLPGCAPSGLRRQS